MINTQFCQFRPSIIGALILGFMAMLPCSAAEPTAEQLEFFEVKIRPVLVQHCYECHSEKSPTVRGSLRLDHREGLIKGGDSGSSIDLANPAKSLLIRALKYEEVEMPPKGKLPPSVVADFEKWIRDGAADPRVLTIGPRLTGIDYAKGSEFWAFQKPVAKIPPVVADKVWSGTEIDRFVRAEQERRGIQPAAAADRRTLIRRAYLDLIGLPPEPVAIETFLADPADDVAAFTKVVDELLKSPHYGERWGRYWLDVARYGEDQAHTFKARNYPRGYLYRDWVVKALNADLPYDRFLTQQIAGDLLDEPARHERIPALGLFALGPVYYQDNGEKDKAMADEWDDRVDTLIRGTQAITISCARCHDHKFDPISMADYYGLVGVFASSQYQERPAVPEEVVAARNQADALLAEKVGEIDRVLSASAKSIRVQLASEIPQYYTNAWKVIQRRKAKVDEKKSIDELVKKEKLSDELLRRWVAYLDEKPNSGATAKPRPYLQGYRDLVKSQKADADLSKDEAALADVRKVADAFAAQAATAIKLRPTLAKKFDDDHAFVTKADRASVPPGQIPLGNLFDDGPETSLASALASDTFKAAASEKSLGVDRVASGWGGGTQIAPGLRFDFTTLGSDNKKSGAIVNDAWDVSGGIRTVGKKAPANMPRTEQGIGMHANAMITFDLDKIRRVGQLPANLPLRFKVDRAGINDDAIGVGSVFVAVIVSKPQTSKSEYNSILVGQVNGQSVKVDENDGSYYFGGELPKALRGDGKYASFDIEIPLEARYLTLAATGAAQANEENSISSDHAVFSGARLEYTPPTAEVATNVDSTKGEDLAAIDLDSDEAQVAATLLSELVSDKGLLAIPAKDVERFLTGPVVQQLDGLKKERDERKKSADAINVTMAHALADEKGQDLPIYQAGDPKKKGELAPRSFPAIYSHGQRQPFQTTGSGRLELARAITSRDNPLTARVMVNRIWAGHFGYGLVRTPNNFGQLGERPSHPELLDWLAVKFMDSGWSFKQLHRTIMLSATYRLSGASDEKNFGIDPDNRTLWRMNRRRLEVEPWRDSMLAVAGNLDVTAGGPSMELGNSNNRKRTLYGFVSRHRLDDLLRLFDFPDPNITAGQRTVTTVPLQQLFVLNSEFMVNQAKALAARLNREASTDDARIRQAYVLLYSRLPTDAELQLGAEFLAAKPLDADGKTTGQKLTPWEEYAMALLGSNEFAFVD